MATEKSIADNNTNQHLLNEKERAHKEKETQGENTTNFSKVALVAALTILEKALEALPNRIKTISEAVQLRRIALAFIMLASPLRRKMIRVLLVQHVRIENGKIEWKIPSNCVMNKKHIVGFLANVPSAHKAIIRYMQEGRPLLLGDNIKSEYWAVAANGGSGCVAESTIRNDVQIILGPVLNALRYTSVLDSRLKGFTDEQLAPLVHHNPGTGSVYYATDDKDVANVRNQIVALMHERKKAK